MLRFIDDGNWLPDLEDPPLTPNLCKVVFPASVFLPKMPYICCGLFEDKELPCSRGIVVGLASEFGALGLTAEGLGGAMEALGAGAIGLRAATDAGGFGKDAADLTAGGRTAPRYCALAMGVKSSDRPTATAAEIKFFISELLFENGQVSGP